MALHTIHEILPFPQDGQNHIRLLQILPDALNINATIECTLSLACLDDECDFTAISYVWGPPDNGYEILINGFSHLVRKNLWLLLHQLSSESFPRHLWIDAICIDQTWVKERNHQVGLMHEVYQDRDVIAWMGDSNDISHGMLQVRNWEIGRKEDAHDVKGFLSSDYWTRVWVLQEYVLAKTVILRSGSDSCNENVLSNLYLKHVLEADTVKILRYLPHKKMMDARLIHRTRENKNSNDRFLEHAFLKCTDVRDRIYGQLALVDPHELEAFPIVPDYSATPVGLLENLVRRRHAMKGYRPLVSTENKVVTPESSAMRGTREDVQLAFNKLGLFPRVKGNWDFFVQVAHMLELKKDDDEVVAVASKLHVEGVFEDSVKEATSWLGLIDAFKNLKNSKVA